MTNIVCVDFDTLDMDCWEYLPPAIRERSPRGYHIFYKIPDDYLDIPMTPVIKWRGLEVDLLCANSSREMPAKKKFSQMKFSSYHGHSIDNDEEDENEDVKKPVVDWKPHVLVSPTPGYRRVWPDQTPAWAALTDMPDWLLQVLTAQ